MLECKICQDKFNEPVAYVNHINIHLHNSNQPVVTQRIVRNKTYSCGKCLKSYTTLNGLKIHRCKYKERHYIKIRKDDPLNPNNMILSIVPQRSVINNAVQHVHIHNTFNNTITHPK